MVTDQELSPAHSGLALKNAASPLRIAVWTYLMRRFGRFGVLLKDVGHHPSMPNWLKLISLLGSFPMFKLSYLCFQHAYVLGQRRIFVLSGDDPFGEFKGDGVPLHSVVDLAEHLHRIDYGLERANSCKNFANHRSRPPTNSRVV